LAHFIDYRHAADHARGPDPMTSRRSLSVALAGAIALAAAACSPSAEPGWTFAPVPSPTPVPSSASAAPSGSASPGASAGASASPSGAASAAPSASTEETVVEVVALNVKWTETSYGAPADEAFQIELDNQDAGTPHNVSIRDETNTELFRSSPDLTGPATQTYDVPALEAGTYKLICTIHATLMISDLTVGA
jgi:plastocyanin